MNDSRDSLMFCFAGEAGVPGGGESAGGQAVDRAGAVEVDGRLETLAQGAGGLEDGDEGDGGLVGDPVDEREVRLPLLGLVVWEDLGAAVDAGALG